MKHAGILDLWSGVGIVAASMIGAGVFLSAGFMAQQMSAGYIMLAWVVGALLAMAGARTYAEVACMIPRSGGEYRYLSELIHPSVGYLAGWASLLVGFSAPMAISAFSAAAFGFTVIDGGDPRLTATAVILVLAFLHAFDLHWSKWSQNALVAIKGLLIAAFVAVGLAVGSSAWPAWTPAGGDTSFQPLPFATSLFYVAYAFSGWNAAAYAASDFRRPVVDVPRAMLIGCAIVGVAYLLVNWVLVANLTPEKATVVFRYEEARVTLGHVVAQDLLGSAGATVMSLGIALAMVSSTSSMLLVGPRVYAEMARDGFLPAFLRGTHGQPPRASIALQAGLAIALLHLHTIGELLGNVAGILVVFASLVGVGLLIARWRAPHLPAPRPQSLIAAGVYVLSSLWMLYNAFKGETGFLPWLLAVVIIGLGAYAVTAARRPRLAARS